MFLLDPAENMLQAGERKRNFRFDSTLWLYKRIAILRLCFCSTQFVLSRLELRKRDDLAGDVYAVVSSPTHGAASETLSNSDIRSLFSCQAA